MKVLIYNILLLKEILKCSEKQVSNIVLFYMMEKVFNVLFQYEDVALIRNQSTRNTVKKKKRQPILLVCRLLSE